jgi:hypothetical protein
MEDKPLFQLPESSGYVPNCPLYLRNPVNPKADAFDAVLGASIGMT